MPVGRQAEKFWNLLQETFGLFRMKRQRDSKTAPDIAERRSCGPLTTLEFSALVQKYQGLVYTVCHQLVPDAGDAQDLAQETFLSAWRAIDRCPPGYE